MRRLVVASFMLAGGVTLASAQTPSLQQQAPNMPAPGNMPAEKIEPQEPSSTGSSGTLSDKLEKSDGVIRPPETGAPDMRVPAPVPNPGTTPVIPPPGSPGGAQGVQPR